MEEEEEEEDDEGGGGGRLSPCRLMSFLSDDDVASC